MSYTLGYGANLCANIVVQDNESNTIGNVIFPGRNFSGYGSPVDQNFLSMVENFASSNGGPSNPVTGQLWFDPGSNIANVTSNIFDGAVLKFNVANTSGKPNISPTWWRLIYGSNSGVNLGNVGNILIGTPTGNFIRFDATNGNIFTNGNINVGTGGNLTITPEGNITTVGTIQSTSNITGANILTPGTVIANAIVSNGNITGNNLSISNVSNFGGNVTINGNLTVFGNSTFANGSSNLTTDDAIIVLAANTPTGLGDRGVAMRYTSTLTSFMGWETANGEFLLASNANITTAELTGITLGNLRASSVNFANGSWAGNVNPTANLTYDLGTSALRWGNVFGGNANFSGNVSFGGNLAVSGNISGNISLPVGGTLGAPGGSAANTQVIFNDAGNLAGNTNFTFNKVTGDFGVPGNVTAGGLLNGTLGATSASQPNVTTLGTLTNVAVTGNATVSGNLITTAITTGAIATAGTITGQWTLVGASTLEATYADIAERHHSDGEYPVGTVMTVGGQNEITPAKSGSTVVGVISEKYAYLMNSGAGPQESHPAVAYVGRVPVRIIGPINRHDRIEPTTNGCAKHSVKDKNSFGWALESDLREEEKLVLCIIK